MRKESGRCPWKEGRRGQQLGAPAQIQCVPSASRRSGSRSLACCHGQTGAAGTSLQVWRWEDEAGGGTGDEAEDGTGDEA